MPIELYDVAAHSLKWTGAVAAGGAVIVRFIAALNVARDAVVSLSLQRPLDALPITAYHANLLWRNSVP